MPDQLTESQSAREMMERKLAAPLSDLLDASHSGRGYSEARKAFFDAVLAAQAAPGESRKDKLETERNVLNNSFGIGSFQDGITRQRIEQIDAELAVCGEPPPAPGAGWLAPAVARPQDGRDPATIEALAADFENSVHHVWDNNEVAARIRVRAIHPEGKVK